MNIKIIAIVALAFFTSFSPVRAGNWQKAGTSLSFNIIGSLEKKASVIPWEIKGQNNTLRIDISTSTANTQFMYRIDNPVLILGIRNYDKEGFNGQTGIKPQIVFSNVSNFNNKKLISDITLPITNLSGGSVGSLTIPLFTAAISSWSSFTAANGSRYSGGKKILSASANSAGFYGGLPTRIDSSENYDKIKAMISSLDESLLSNFSDQNLSINAPGDENFNNELTKYYSVYCAGIPSGSLLTLKINKPLTGKITWQASLPITISYR
ncbi:hypothetical protein QUR00_004342 [Escherichia coli]|nr:hypothetical protein [Escherichia coli]